MAGPDPGDRDVGGGGAPEAPASASPRGAGASWAWPAAFVIVVLAMLGAGLYIFESLRRIPGQAMEGGRAVLGELRSLAAAFERGTVRNEFLTYAARTEGTTYLQFATLDQVEVFRRRDTSTVLWGRLQLPDVVVEATVPVTYTYYVDLGGDWSFRQLGDQVWVTAPPIEYNPPAVDASAVRLEPRTSSLLRDEGAAMEALRQGLSELLDRRARESVSLVRETGRRQIAEFVSTWMADAFDDADELTVRVVFEDEPPRLEPRRD